LLSVHAFLCVEQRDLKSLISLSGIAEKKRTIGGIGRLSAQISEIPRLIGKTWLFGISRGYNCVKYQYVAVDRRFLIGHISIRQTVPFSSG